MIERYLYPLGFRSPDADEYLAERPAPPFGRRWFTRGACGGSIWHWRILTWSSVVVLVALLARDLGPLPALAFLGLSMVRTWVRIGVTPDAYAFLAAYAATVPGPWYTRVAWALMAGGSRETAPVFAALWSWSPLPLVGLLAVPWWRPGAPLRLFRPAWGIGPWGFLPALISWDVRAAACVVVGYAQCLIASDGARLYQWACVPLLVALSHEQPLIQAGAAISIWLARYEV